MQIQENIFLILKEEVTMSKTRKISILLLLFSFIFIFGCSVSSKPSEGKQKSEDTNLSLKVGLMPAVDSAPMFIAEKEGYFKELGLDIELIVFNNAQDRQTALQTNSIDGAMTDLIAVTTNVNSGFDIKATTMTSGKFPVLVKNDFKEKKNIKVGMMEVSVSNFLIDQWLSKDYKIEKVFINEIPARLEMIKSGNVDMGLFPEPLASMGALGGLKKRIYEPEEGYSPDVMVFTGKALKEKTAAIQSFHQAYNKAIEYINRDENIAKDILIEKLDLKEEVKDIIVLPNYSKASLPDDAYLLKIINWVETVLNKDIKVKPQDLIEGNFIK